MIVIGIDPGLTGAISIMDDNGYLAIYDMPKQVKSVKRKRNKQGKMQDYTSYEVDAEGLGLLIHPNMIPVDCGPVKIYIERVGPVYRQDKKGGTDAYQPLHATAVQMEGAGVLRGVCEVYYGKDNVTRVSPVTWKKHFGLLKTEKDYARIYAINNILIKGVPDLLRRKKDGGRADSLLIGTYGLNIEQDKIECTQ